MKFARRHWLTTASVAMVILTLAASQIVLVQNNRDLQRERDRANREAVIAKRATEFTVGLFLRTSPGNAVASAREVLDAGVRQLEHDSLLMTPDVGAALYEAAAHAYRAANELGEASRLFEIVLTLRRQDLENDPASYANSLVNFAQLIQLSGNNEKSAQLLQEAIDIYQRIGTTNDVWPLTSKTAVAHMWGVEGRYNEAADLMASALAEVDEESEDQYALASAFVVHARTRTAQSHFEEAETLLRRALDMEQRRAAKPTALSRDAKSALATLYKQKGDIERAIPVMAELVDEMRQVYGDDDPLYATALNNLANTLEEHGTRLSEAEQLYEEAIRVSSAAMGADHLYTLIMRSNLAALYGTRGEWQRSRDAYVASLGDLQKTQGDNHWRTADAKRGLARALVGLQQAEDAERLLRESLPVFLEQFGDAHWRTAVARHVLGLAMLGQQQAGGIKELRDARTVLEATLGSAHPRTILVAEDLARAEAHAGQS